MRYITDLKINDLVGFGKNKQGIIKDININKKLVLVDYHIKNGFYKQSWIYLNNINEVK